MWHAQYRKHIEGQTGVSKIYFNPTVVLQMAVKMLYTTRAPQYLKYCCKYVKPLPYIPTRWRCMRRCCSCALTMSPPPTCTSTMPDLWASGSLAFPSVGGCRHNCAQSREILASPGIRHPQSGYTDPQGLQNPLTLGIHLLSFPHSSQYWSSTQTGTSILMS